MTIQTFTIQEAESKFRLWLNQVLSSEQTVMLTTDDAQQPMALLMPVLSNDDDGQKMLMRHVELLESIIPLWQQELQKTTPTTDFASLCQTQLRILFERAPNDLSTFSSAVMLLRLAARTLKNGATIDQLTAFQNALAILKKIDLTTDDLNQIDQLLLDSNLDIQADIGDADLVNAYVDAL